MKVDTDDELNADQLATMDALWIAQRAGQVDDETAAAIERLVREGRVHTARRRLGAAKRAAQ